MIERRTMVDPPLESGTTRWSEVAFTGLLADSAPAGVPALGVMSVASAPASMGWASGGGVLCLLVLIVAVSVGRGDRVEDLMVGATRSFGRPTA